MNLPVVPVLVSDQKGVTLRHEAGLYLGAYTTSSIANRKLGLTCSRLRAVSQIRDEVSLGKNYRSNTPSGPKSAAALTQMPPKAAVARHAATFSCTGQRWDGHEWMNIFLSVDPYNAIRGV